MKNQLSISDMRKLTGTWWLLKIGYGLYWFAVGIDKFFGMVTVSEQRVGKVTLSLIPVSLRQLLHIIGAVEIIIAVMILTKWPRWGSYLGLILMAGIVLNLILMGAHYDIAIHGTIIALGMSAFIVLTEVLGK